MENKYVSERVTGQEARVKLAIVQMQPSFGEREGNLKRTLELIEQASQQGANLVILPELCNTGYVFNSRAEVTELAEPIPEGPSVRAWVAAARANGLHVVAGLCEREGDRFFNSAVLVGPEGYIGTYRKTHLFYEEKLFFEPGDLGFPVFRLPFGNLGILICYDIRFPEPCRIMMLQGADIICVPTNWVSLFNTQFWDERGFCMADYIAMANAAVNQVFFACANRIGEERGVGFLGASLIVSPSGWPMAGPGSKDQEEILYADVNLSDARRGKVKNQFNDTVRDRRTDLYDEMLGYTRHPKHPF